MAKSEETQPLTGVTGGTGYRFQQAALSLTAVVLVITTVFCLPPVVPLWHGRYFTHSVEIEQRAWTWLGVNSLWMAMTLLWTVFHPDNGPAAASACLLCALFWGYLDIVVITQWARGKLALVSIADFVVHFALLVFCVRAAWSGVASPVRTSRADGSHTRRRAFRKWALVVCAIQLLCAFIGCWPSGLPWTSPASERESAPWEWNSAVLFVLALAVLWAAFLTRGGFVDETKQAMCAWCALVFTGGFVLSSFDWPWLGLFGRNLTTAIVLALDMCILGAAALN